MNYENESEYDKRQLNLMLYKIEVFKKGNLRLSELIYDLEGLLSVLILKDNEWKDEFSGYWMDLEQVNASAIYLKKTSLGLESQKIVINAIEHLEQMVNKKLLEYPNLENGS